MKRQRKKTFKWKTILKIISLTIVVLTLLIGGIGGYTIRQSWAQENGQIKLSGLKETVEVRRDKWGVPHIYASNQHDLFMAQGYIHAQDRFWQMDFWRHAGSGRLSEMFGKSQVETDQFLRTLGWARVAQQELTQIQPEMGDILQAYADGVNKYLLTHQGNAISLEYAVLKLLNPDYKPETWIPLHTLTWGKVMAWDLGSNMSKEIQRTILLKTLTPAQIDELFPPYPIDQPLIVKDFKTSTIQSSININSPINQDIATAISPSLQSINNQLNSLDKILGETGSGIGSNNWVISGKRTNTGKPILANDPHLAVQMPSIWYEIGLHCTLKNANCPYDVTGFSFPGMIGAIVGHNDHIAWGVTNVGPDVMDLYVEKINPKNPNQYEVNGKWIDMQLISENINVAGNKSISQTVRYTRHGPVISDTYQILKEFSSNQNRVDIPNNYAIALRWTALEPSKLVYAIPAINRAKNWQEFRIAVQNFDVPSQNFVYADIMGNIGYQMPGKIPIRESGDGRYPVPGWIDKFEWKGYIPFAELPFIFNPPQGYISTANNAVVGKDYPYLITTDWDYGYRAERIIEMIESNKKLLGIEDVKKMHGDNKNLNAETLVPILMQIPLKHDYLESIRNLLQGWNFQQNLNESAAALFETFWKHLLADTFHDNLPKKYYPYGGNRWFEVIRNLVKQPNSFWWDNQNTKVVENRDIIFRQAFTEAVKELENTLGKNPKNWRWGDLHTVTFSNLTLGKSGIAPLEAIFNRGPFPTAGSGEIVNATAWDASQSFQVTWLPSMRMIIDLSKLENSLAIHTTGQSGHAFHRHYNDMIDPWRKIKYHHILWNQDIINKTVAHLTLIPEKI